MRDAVREGEGEEGGLRARAHMQARGQVCGCAGREGMGGRGAGKERTKLMEPCGERKLAGCS